MQVLFTRENVSVYPARKQRIAGRVSLLKLKSATFFAWLPYRQAGAEITDKPVLDEDADDTPTGSLCKSHSSDPKYLKRAA